MSNLKELKCKQCGEFFELEWDDNEDKEFCDNCLDEMDDCECLDCEKKGLLTETCDKCENQ